MEQTFEEYARIAEWRQIQHQTEANGISFIEHQSKSWDELQHWWEQAGEFGSQPETANGPGSTIEATEQLRAWLPDLLDRYQINTMLDAACGDWNWLRYVDIGDIEYTGWDTGRWLIDRCLERLDELSEPPDAIFERINLLTVPEVPEYDLILCRDFFTFLTNQSIRVVLNKFKISGSRYLLASNYRGADNKFVYKPQDFTYFGYMERPVNLEAEPFSLRRVEGIDEMPGPGGVIGKPHELALFDLSQ